MLVPANDGISTFAALVPASTFWQMDSEQGQCLKGKVSLQAGNQIHAPSVLGARQRAAPALVPLQHRDRQRGQHR